jgi:hypothetical protein
LVSAAENAVNGGGIRADLPSLSVDACRDRELALATDPKPP